jgi:phage replication-related protein YjqB (UPF0714/DUF867 family)
MLADMADKYASFAELARFAASGTDYRVRSIARPDSPVIVIAPHGGGIEVGTSELAQRIAGEDHSFFAFEGLRPYGRNRDLHITSHRFDHPECLALVERCAVTLAVHGCIGESRIYVGGLDDGLTARLTEQLSAAGFHASADGHRYPGRNPLNICNRGARGRGAQIEVTKDLRDTRARARITDVVRGALADYVTTLSVALDSRSDLRSRSRSQPPGD